MKIIKSILYSSLAFFTITTQEAQAEKCDFNMCFSFPSPNNKDFYAPYQGKGPFLVDHHQYGTKGYCHDYMGRDFPHCYKQHDGSDFILKGAFETMETVDTPVMASYGGEVIFYQDSNWDKCHVAPKDWLQGGDGITCGIDPETGEERPQNPNYVVIRHNLGAFTIYTYYYHLKTNSVPQSIKDVVKNDGKTTFPINCGQRIGFVGSSGTSTAPHIHFEVKLSTTNNTPASLSDINHNSTLIDPYFGRWTLLDEPDRTSSMWEELRSFSFLPKSSCTYSDLK